MNSLLILTATLVTTADDLGEFQGTWVLVSRKVAGEEETITRWTRFKLIFEGDTVIAQRQGMTVPFGRYRLDPKQKPKAYDQMIDDASLDGGSVTLRGIYELDGDTLRLCISRPGDRRPTAFATRPERGWLLLVYRREGAGKADSP